MADKVFLSSIDEGGVNASVYGRELTTYKFSKEDHYDFLVLYVEDDKSSEYITRILEALND